MKRLILLLFTLLSLTATAQVDNYCLRFTSDKGVVNLGVNNISATQNYTIQMWFCPARWTQGAALLRCGTYSIRLGVDHALVFNDGQYNFSVTHQNIAANTWTHLTLRASATETEIFINNNLVKTYPARLTLPCKEKSIWLGGGYQGRIDEVRLWGKLLSNQYDLYWRTTLNELNPDWALLMSYWKMDQEQCPNLVDYRNRHHGTLSASGVAKEKVTDNNKFKYLISLGYGNVERYFDRAIDAPHYWLNNRISIIGAVAENSDCHLYLDREDASLVNGATYLPSYNKRNGVLSLPTANARLAVPAGVLKGMSNYTVETWVYIDEWTEGAYIFRNENSDGTQGISLRLGSEETLSLILRCNGTDYNYAKTGKKGTWFHVGFAPKNSSTKPESIFIFALNGTTKSCTTDATEVIPRTMPNTDTPITFGEGLKGALDEVTIFSSVRDASQMGQDSQQIPLPGADKAMSAAEYYSMRALYHFDLEKEPGFDAFSVQGFFDKMRSYTAGMRGVKFTLTVASNDFDNYLGNATTRTKLAQKIAQWGNDPHFDGIDLDFEWTYTAAGWRRIGQLCQAIRDYMHEGKILSVSPHQVSYAFPTDLMKYVDYFNFQCYGPNKKDLCTTDGFENCGTLFESAGYPKEKIILSYSTTTTSGYQGGTRKDNLQPQGYRYLYPGEEDYDPTINYMHSEQDKADYWIAGFNQVVWRNKRVVDRDFGGLMYWDMGNDLPATSKHSFARASTYYINSNVEKLVTSVAKASTAPEDDPLAPTDTPDPEDQGGEILSGSAITSISQLKNNMAYTISNSNGLGTIYSDESQEKVWLGNSSNSNFGQEVDLGRLTSQWLVINYKSMWYLYNIGRKEFVVVPAFNVTSQPCTFTAEPTPLEVTEVNGQFRFRTITTEEKGFMCASPQLKDQGNPVCQWTAGDTGSQWTLTTVPALNAEGYLLQALRLIDPTATSLIVNDKDTHTPVYTLDGRRMQGAAHTMIHAPKGLYIQAGKKILKR